VLEGEGRKPGKTDEELAALFVPCLPIPECIAWKATSDHQGRRVLESAWHGTEQVRFYKLEGDRLQVTSAWRRALFFPERQWSVES